ncbi:alpha/beta-hydrolase [Byssothecium circinans]|uniref:Alpha/beta-hydrolase n=1 Tax=Byssothecium circinans TaxID=147558 RepID=A0A6A5T9I5_9PLEO|nr:alpha/beta-hydrolase [Byssothecium circinans]
MVSKTGLALSLLALPAALAAPSTKPPTNTIKWTQCAKNLTVPSECGTITVPLDYSGKLSNKTLELSMLKIKAVKKPFKGSILINPGGPGAGNEATTFLQGLGANMLIMTGGHFDLIGIDPRGTSKTLPINCFPNPSDRIATGIYMPPSLDASNTSLGTAFSYSKVFAANCYQQMQDFGRFIGTASVARDFMQVVDALGEDGMLRYWGQSYGTVLGATLAALFPDRIDRMVVDGVVNIHDYTEGWEYDNLGVGELALHKMLEACVKAGPKACPLATKGDNATELFVKINELDELARREPIVLGVNVTTDIVTVGQIPGAIDAALRIGIASARPLSGYLNAIIDRNVTAYRAYKAAFLGASSGAEFSAAGDSTLSIRCTDSTFRTDSFSEVQSRAEKMTAGSRLFGGMYGLGCLLCSFWKMDGVERYTGDFKVKTKNPVLLVGSPYDLRTPLKSAVNMSEGLEGSVVLQHNGLGHCVMYSPGQCAIKAVANYFTNGTLPAKGTVCEQDFDVFSGKSIKDSFDLEKL